MNEAQIIIYTPGRKHWQQLKQIRLEALQTDPQAFCSSYVSELYKSDDDWKAALELTLMENPKELLVAAFDDDTVVAILGAFEKDEKTWRLKNAYVKPQYRRQGIGGRLLEKAVHHIDSKKNVEMIELVVNVHQKAAIHLYQKFGFNIIETVKSQKFGDGKFYDQYIMRRMRKNSDANYCKG